jgi:hypothetical protein
MASSAFFEKASADRAVGAGYYFGMGRVAATV